MTLAQFTEPKLLVPRLLSNHRESAIIELSRRLKSAGRIENADSFVDAAMDHESIASAVFDGVTFPLALWSSTVRQPGRGDTAYSTGRARGRAVKELSFAAGLSRQGIRWGAGRSPCGVGVCASSGGLPCFTPRGEPVVHTVVLFAVPLAEGQTYLSLVVTFSSFMKDETAFSALRRCVRPEAMLNVLEQVLALWSSTVRQPGGGDTAYSTGRACVVAPGSTP